MTPQNIWSARGHRNIGVIAGVSDNLHSIYRLLGYQTALFEEGIPFNPSWVFHGRWNRQSGYEGAKHLFCDQITALFCMNDDMAAGAYDFFYEQGLEIGRDISVIGYDNMVLSDYLHPSLTTSEIPLGEIGKKAVDMMLDILKGSGSAEQPRSHHQDALHNDRTQVCRCLGEQSERINTLQQNDPPAVSGNPDAAGGFYSVYFYLNKIPEISFRDIRLHPAELSSDPHRAADACRQISVHRGQPQYRQPVPGRSSCTVLRVDIWASQSEVMSIPATSRFLIPLTRSAL